MRDFFQKIYKESVWGKGSGVGSIESHTVRYRGVLKKLLSDLHIRSVLDVGCGDWQLGSLVDWSGIDYLGMDVVPMVIEANRAKFKNYNFIVGDVLEDPLPSADLLIAKDVLQHWPEAAVEKFIPILKQYRYALITNDVDDPSARTEHWVHWHPVDLTKAPYSLKGELLLADKLFPEHPLKCTYLFRN